MGIDFQFFYRGFTLNLYSLTIQIDNRYLYNARRSLTYKQGETHLKSAFHLIKTNWGPYV